MFCKIVAGTIPCAHVCETELSFAFLDVGPLADGHALVIPKRHAARFHEMDEESARDVLATTLRVAKAMDVAEYNILQNNGRTAHQAVDHVHFHIIPKPDADQGLGIVWPARQADPARLADLAAALRRKIA